MQVADESGRIRVPAVREARRFLSRLRGLLGLPGVPPGHGLWLEPCSAVHTWGMRFAIDVVFLDAAGRVLRVVPGLRPGRWASARGAHAVLELASGEAAARGIAEGMRLLLVP